MLQAVQRLHLRILRALCLRSPVSFCPLFALVRLLLSSSAISQHPLNLCLHTMVRRFAHDVVNIA